MLRRLGLVIAASLVFSNAWADTVFGDFAGFLATDKAMITSPATAVSGDWTNSWGSPQGSTITSVVKIPHPLAAASTVTVAAVPSGEDARPYFEDALAKVRAQKAGMLVIPSGTYVFKTLNPVSHTHLYLNNLTDLTINGQGSTLVFMQAATGIKLQQAQRVQLASLKIEYNLKLYSYGKIVRQGRENFFVVDADYPVTASDPIYKLNEYDLPMHEYVVGGQRTYYNPGTTLPTYVGNQTYTSPAFQHLTVGKTFLAFHTYYVGAAISVDDSQSSGKLQSEDITINGVTINSGPGMGITTLGLKRGLGIWNSTITPKAGSLVSTSYDGIHTSSVGGDVSILNNHINRQDDDAINLSTPVTPIVSVANDGETLTLSTASFYIRQGELVSVFDAQNNFLGMAYIKSEEPFTGGTRVVTLDHKLKNIETAAIVRNLTYTGTRATVQGNTIGDCGCHGILVETPNAIVTKNIIDHTSDTAIRLWATTGFFVEGLGAINVSVSNNTLSNIGADAGYFNAPFGAISALGTNKDSVNDSPVNKYLTISGNSITNAAQACIMIASSQAVLVSNNVCTNVQQLSGSAVHINILKAINVVVKDSVCPSVTAEKVWVDEHTTSAIQLLYAKCSTKRVSTND